MNRMSLYFYCCFFICCHTHSDPKCERNVFKYIPFQIHILPDKKLPYHADEIIALGHDSLYENGIPVFTYYWMDGKKYFHPCLMAQKALDMLNNYRLTNDSAYVKHAVLIAEKLIDMAVIGDDSAWFFPYPFKFYVHDLNDQVLMPPWVSGMAQGQILSLFIRLYKYTMEEKYKRIAEGVFRSFYPLKGSSQTWVTMIDCDSNIWIEEYPMEAPCHALNGFVFSIYGIYDYYILTHSEKSRKMLLGCLTTVYNKMKNYRIPGEPSYYCLKHRHQNTYYHNVHIQQFRKLYEITHDTRFLVTSILLKKDFYNIH